MKKYAQAHEKIFAPTVSNNNNSMSLEILLLMVFYHANSMRWEILANNRFKELKKRQNQISRSEKKSAIFFS